MNTNELRKKLEDELRETLKPLHEYEFGFISKAIPVSISLNIDTNEIKYNYDKITNGILEQVRLKKQSIINEYSNQIKELIKKSYFG